MRVELLHELAASGEQLVATHMPFASVGHGALSSSRINPSMSPSTLRFFQDDPSVSRISLRLSAASMALPAGVKEYSIWRMRSLKSRRST